MRVYLAAAFSRQAEIAQIARSLRQRGVEVTSQWLENTSASYKEIADQQEDAFMDIRDLREADVFVRFTDELSGPTIPSRLGTGARMFEFGMAWERGMPVVVVGGIQNVFDSLPNVTHLKDTEELLEWVGKRERA